MNFDLAGSVGIICGCDQSFFSDSCSFRTKNFVRHRLIHIRNQLIVFVLPFCNWSEFRFNVDLLRVQVYKGFNRLGAPSDIYRLVISINQLMSLPVGSFDLVGTFT